MRLREWCAMMVANRDLSLVGLLFTSIPNGLAGVTQASPYRISRRYLLDLSDGTRQFRAASLACP